MCQISVFLHYSDHIFLHVYSSIFQWCWKNSGTCMSIGFKAHLITVHHKEFSLYVLDFSLSLSFSSPICSLDSLLPLCGLPHLTSLCLRVHGTTSLSNPLCSAVDHGGYGLFMRQSFPHLHWLDGERVAERGGVRGEKAELERELGKLEAVGGAGEREREPDSIYIYVFVVFQFSWLPCV